MRLNKWLVLSNAVTSRRKADDLISTGAIKINDRVAQLGDAVCKNDKVYFDDKQLKQAILESKLVLINKPRGLVCSHQNQKKSRIIFDVLPEEFRRYIIVGRLDRDSEGLVLLTNDGALAHWLMHPSHNVERVYEVSVDKTVNDELISNLLKGVRLSDGISCAKKARRLTKNKLQITLGEGRNRQIRRTLAKLNYSVTRLVRIQHGPYKLGDLAAGKHKIIKKFEEL